MNENLNRSIGVFGLATAVFNMTVGAGIFVLPALAAEKLGAPAIVCFVVSGVAIFLISLCFAELGSKITISGGAYTYINAAFGPYTGFIANYLFVFGSCVLSDAAIANAIAITLSYFYPELMNFEVKTLFFVGIFGLLAYINIRNIKYGLRFVIGTAFFKLIPIVMLLAFGFGHVQFENLIWEEVPTIQNIGMTTLILFYAFVGVENVVSNGGEFKNPARTVPLGIFIGIVFVVILYILLQIVSQGILGDELIQYKDAPLTEVATRLFGNYGITLVVIGIAVSMLGGLAGSIMSIPRITFAGANNGIYPKFMSSVHPEYKTPYKSIIVYSSLGFIFAMIGELKQLIILSSASCLIIYLGVVLATIKLRYKDTEKYQKAFVIPGGWTVPILAAIFIIYILSNLSQIEFIGIAVAIMVLSITYYLRQQFLDKRKIRS